MSQNSQENACTRVSFLIKLQASPTLLKKSLWYRCFPVNFAKFLRTPFLTEHLQWLLLFFKNNLEHLSIKFSGQPFSKGSPLYDRCFKLLLKITHILQEKVPTVGKKLLRLVLRYLGTISLQTGTKMQKPIKGVLSCCKLKVFLQSQNKLCNSFRFKDPVPQILTLGVVYKFQRGLCNEFYYR